jgi:site-specific DNA-methyltransferase (adenine-specific)
MLINKIIQGDALEKLKELSDESIDCVVTSPPYWKLRNYNIAGQIGLEKTYQEFIKNLCDIFDEVKRVLKLTGSCWVVIGDTYAGSGSGWLLRNEIIWHKPNVMPSSAKDRFTVDFEKVFFFTKKKDYFFEQQFEHYTKPLNRWGGPKTKSTDASKGDDFSVKERDDRLRRPNQAGRNMRTVWSINTRPFAGAHFATFPESLIEPMIKAGCPQGGIVLDPFMGAGTTAVVAVKHGRNYLGIELNPDYIKIAEERIKLATSRQKIL